MAKKKAKTKNLSKQPPAGLSAAESNLLKQPPTRRPQRDKILSWLCLSGIIILAFLLNLHTLTDTDIFWHLTTGQIIWTTHQVPQKDIYSFTVAGKEWIDSQWLFQLIIYVLYRFSGYSGMILFGALLSAITWALVLGPGYNGKKYFFIILLALVSLLAGADRMKLRPELLTFFFLALEIFLLDKYQQGKKYVLSLLPLLLLLWVNSEGLWPIYFFVLAVFLCEDILRLPRLGLSRYLKRSSPEPARSAVWRLGICFLSSLPLALVNPHGYRGAVFPLQLLREISSAEGFFGKMIGEFQSPFLFLDGFSRSMYIAVIVLSSLCWLMLLLRRKVYPAAFLVWAVFLYLSISALRNVALFALVTPALLSKVLAGNLAEEVLPRKRVFARAARLRPLGAAGILIFMIGLGAEIASNRFFIRNKTFYRFGVGALETEYPIRAAQFLKSIPGAPGQRENLKIFTDLDAAGYIIWAGYPEWKVYTDPRLEVYGEEFAKHFVSLFQDWAAFEAEDLKYNFDAVFLSGLLKGMGFIETMYSSPNWTLVYFDGQSIIFLKHPTAAAGRSFLENAVRTYRLDLSRGLPGPLSQNLGGPWLAGERKNRGIILGVLGYPQLALPEFTEALKIIPGDNDLEYSLGWALFKLGRYEEARSHVGKAAEADPDFIPYRILLAWDDVKLGQTELAIQGLREALEKNPMEISVCINLAKIYETIKSPGALDQWRYCLEIYQSNPQAFSASAGEIFQALQRLQPGK